MKFFDFFQDVYDYFFESISIQERRFKSDYDLLRLKFIADHHSELKDPKASELAFKDDLSKPVSSYAELCKNVINLLHPQNREAKRLDTDSKFKLLNVARREQILVYKNFECDTRIKQILVESTKLDSWRKEAILQLLGKYKDREVVGEDPKLYEPVRVSLYEAAYIRDVHFDNLYYKSKIAKRTISFLNMILSLLLLAILTTSAILEYAYEQPRDFLLGPFSDLWLVVLFGLLGAAFSTLLNLYKGDKLKNTIIKQIDAVNLTRARLVIGACAVLIVFMILNSNLITIKGFNEPIDPTSTNKLPLPLTIPMLSLIFVGGFTERLVLNFIDKLSAQAGKSDDSDKIKELESTLETAQSAKQASTNGKAKKNEETKILENVAEEIANKTNDDKSTGGDVSE
jgi:hypothetical protein